MGDTNLTYIENVSFTGETNCRDQVTCLSALTQVLFASVFGFIIIFGILGNIFIIWAIGSDKKDRKSSVNLMLLNLATVDLGNLVSVL